DAAIVGGRAGRLYRDRSIDGAAGRAANDADTDDAERGRSGEIARQGYRSICAGVANEDVLGDGIAGERRAQGDAVAIVVTADDAQARLCRAGERLVGSRDG